MQPNEDGRNRRIFFRLRPATFMQPISKVSLHIPLGCLPHAYVLSSSIKINLPRISAGFCLSPVHSPNAPTRPAGASVRPLLSSRPSRTYAAGPSLLSAYEPGWAFTVAIRASDDQHNTK